MIILSVGYAAYRRFGEKLPRLKQGESRHRGFSPISSLLSLLSAGTGRQAAYWLVYVCWWLHLLILLAFLLYVPQSKHAHLLFVPFDIVLSGTGPPGRPCKLDFSDETAEEFGVGKIEHFTKGQLLDLYACVECGRCTNMWR
ncbi:hypothetical protein EXW96_02030 [Paenibacillus sp. JMULE4]|uniref:hypothetical protein n=1 Tax=Paenibacillus TaxID=44249 RepID=UPI0008828307|nr:MULTISPECIES: hypothetical protein [Paenibacillus]NTZ16397.1 hypothetical protein [Paenibacillus sp. JMULE4]SDH84959.1 hypothetical protein SAMN05421868_101317 [Paenibacillus naphthalenovorans]